MKLSILKIISITSLVTVMLGGVSVVQADKLSSEEAQKIRAEKEKALGTLNYTPLPENNNLGASAQANPNPFAVGLSPSTRRINAPTRDTSEYSNCNSLEDFNFIGVDDQGLNNSDFFVMDLTVPQGEPGFIDYLTNGRHKGYDIEGLDSLKNPVFNCLWGTSGDNDDKRENPACETGCLYLIDKNDGDLTLYGDICTTEADLAEVDALAFRMNENLGWEEIWGWAQHQGLFQSPTPVPQEGLCGDNRQAVRANMVCAYNQDEPTHEPDKNKFNDLVVEDLTWVDNRGVFYLAMDQTIFMLKPEGCGFKFVCINQTEIEATEYLSVSGLDLLVVGFHAPDLAVGQNSVAAIDLNDPTEDGVFCKFLPTNFPIKQDVEGLAYP